MIAQFPLTMNNVHVYFVCRLAFCIRLVVAKPHIIWSVTSWRRWRANLSHDAGFANDNGTVHDLYITLRELCNVQMLSKVFVKFLVNTQTSETDDDNCIAPNDNDNDNPRELCMYMTTLLSCFEPQCLHPWHVNFLCIVTNCSHNASPAEQFALDNTTSRIFISSDNFKSWMKGSNLICSHYLAFTSPRVLGLCSSRLWRRFRLRQQQQ